MKHFGEKVELETESEDKVQLPFDQYKKIVHAFVEEVEKFYGDPTYKNEPTDKFCAEGFALF